MVIFSLLQRNRKPFWKPSIALKLLKFKLLSYSQIVVGKLYSSRKILKVLKSKTTLTVRRGLIAALSIDSSFFWDLANSTKLISGTCSATFRLILSCSKPKIQLDCPLSFVFIAILVESSPAEHRSNEESHLVMSMLRMLISLPPHECDLSPTGDLSWKDRYYYQLTQSMKRSQKPPFLQPEVADYYNGVID
ncbi:hypothetical protein KIN20_017632 [Parelaphostrongylus tenuis]|uniref:Uncharacterized protein n=1 Tax=Parelaphostrongylus tenuis TaxID=148309 RepID=A0AAD5QTX6_PARTN|nr:hypothetical protein KIN20_017632 [Parelaphostrongylus tenuis]